MDYSIASLLFVFCIVFLGYTIQTISGFGAVIFSLPLSLIVFNRLEILPVFLFMSIFQSFSVAYRDRRYINIKEYLVMFILALIGMPIGIYITELVPVRIMNICLGVLIISNSIINLYKKLGKKSHEKNMTIRPVDRLYPFLSGILQSAYGVGGPLISLYMDRVTENKNSYRGMLSLFWCMLNPFIVIGYLTRGEIHGSHFILFVILFPAVLLALLVGNRIVEKISKDKFQLFVHGILLFIGITMFW